MAASSSGRVARSVPLNARPTGVRTEETTTTSRIGNSVTIVARRATGFGTPDLPSSFPATREAIVDRDVSNHRAGRRNGIAVCAHAFPVKLNRLADEILHFVERFARSAKARQVGSVCAPAGGRFFVDDEVFHLFNVPGGMLPFNCCFHPSTRALFPSASASGTIPFF